MKAGSVQASFMGHCFPRIGKEQTEDTFQALICFCIPKMDTLDGIQVIREGPALRVEVGRFMIHRLAESPMLGRATSQIPPHFTTSIS